MEQLGQMNGIIWLIVVGAGLFFLLSALVMLARFYRKVDQGHALIVNTMRAEPLVTFTGKVVLPIVHRAEVMDISVKTIELDRRGKDGLICKDNIRADIKVTFFVRVNKTGEDVLKVAQSIGCRRASDQETLEQLFVAKFSEGLKTVGKRLEFEELYTKRDDFRDQIIEVIGKDLNGFVLDDAAIDYLEQTQLEQLDPQNILDAFGIRKITEITAGQNIFTNELKQEERKAIKKKNVESDEAVLELDRQHADAQAKQAREIAVVRAREEAETLRVQAEERKKAEQARIKQEEEVAILDENRQRQVQVAQKGRERVIAVETERVERERELEVISREREVELQRIDKEKALEIERKAIADVIAGRIAVEKNVAEEEERINDLRTIAEAKRAKDAKIIGAEGAAQEKLVMSIKEAEAQEQVATHRAKEKLTLAEADLEASDRIARAKIRTADGAQAEFAAEGLAMARVKEADALAAEKFGTAEAKVTLDKMQAAAKGEEEQGMAKTRVREAEALAIERQGKAEAQAVQDMLLAQAAGEERKGMAAVAVREAEASAVEKLGIAEAQATRLRLEAEAAGTAEKANAFKQLDAEGRLHEEFRLQLEQRLKIELESLGVRRDVAREHATVMAKAMENAKVNIVGGDGAFMKQFFQAVSLGHAMDGAVANSELLQNATQDYRDGSASVREDIKDVLTRSGLTTESVKNLSIAAVLQHLLKDADAEQRPRLAQLAEHAKTLGLS